MPYKYYASYFTVTSPPNQEFINAFQQSLNDQFANASDVFTIQEEYPFGSGKYRNVVVRINSAIQAETSIKLGDDFKRILFSDISHPTGIGYKYRFDDNDWIVVNSEVIKNLAASCTVRRCNNTLRWQDVETGAIYSIPIIFNYDIRENRNYASSASPIVMPSGFIDVVTQFNPISNKIKPNQRFLIGNKDNWIAYRVLGGGINNFNNTKTYDNMSSGLLDITIEVNSVNEDTDDLINGIADVKKHAYVITLNQTNVVGIINQTVQLVPTIRLNGEVVDRDVVWTSNNAKSTVSSSGLVTMIATGTSVITCSLAGNPNVTATATMTINSTMTDYYEIKTFPETNFILEGQTQQFQVYLYKNGIQQANFFTYSFSSTNNAPAENYVFTQIDDYTISIKNLRKYLENPLRITCTNQDHVGEIQIWLKGMW